MSAEENGTAAKHAMEEDLMLLEGDTGGVGKKGPKDRQEKDKEERREGENAGENKKKEGEDKESRRRAGEGQRKRQEEDRYSVHLTVHVFVDGSTKDLSMLDLLRGIKKDCGMVVGCRVKGERKYEITMQDFKGKETLMAGLIIKNCTVTAQELGSNEVTVSFLHVPVYIRDHVLLRKLGEWGAEPASEMRRRMVPGTDGEVADGTRIMRVKLSEKVRSLPYSTKIDVVGGTEYVRVLHDNQVPVCRKCIQPGHLFKNCPEFVCFKCHKQGHFARDCSFGGWGDDGRERGNGEQAGPSGVGKDAGGGSAPEPKGNEGKRDREEESEDISDESEAEVPEGEAGLGQTEKKKGEKTDEMGLGGEKGDMNGEKEANTKGKEMGGERAEEGASEGGGAMSPNKKTRKRMRLQKEKEKKKENKSSGIEGMSGAEERPPDGVGENIDAEVGEDDEMEAEEAEAGEQRASVVAVDENITLQEEIVAQQEKVKAVIEDTSDDELLDVSEAVPVRKVSGDTSGVREDVPLEEVVDEAKTSPSGVAVEGGSSRTSRGRARGLDTPERQPVRSSNRLSRQATASLERIKKAGDQNTKL